MRPVPGQLQRQNEVAGVFRPFSPPRHRCWLAAEQDGSRSKRPRQSHQYSRSRSTTLVDEGDTFFQTSNILENEIQSFGQILVLIVRGYVWHNDKIIGGPATATEGEGLRFENIEYGGSGQGASFQCGGESVICPPTRRARY